MSILEQYVDNELTPSAYLKNFMKKNIKSIRNVLTRNSSLKPREFHLGGSLAKDTMLAQDLDADLVFVYNRSEEVENNWRKLVTIVFKVLDKMFQNVEVEEAGNLAIHIKTSLDNCPVKFDITSCYYVEPQNMTKEQTHSKLFRPMTTVWHTRYLQRYKNIKYFTHVVRLLKHWKKRQGIPSLKNFHLELITADVFYNVNFNIASIGEIDDVLMLCLKNINRTLDGYPIIPHWKRCKKKNFSKHYDCPVIFDPANPDDNLLANLEPDIKYTKKKIKKIITNTMENLKQRNYEDFFINYSGSNNKAVKVGKAAKVDRALSVLSKLYTQRSALSNKILAAQKELLSASKEAARLKQTPSKKAAAVKKGVAKKATPKS